ncbi:uncharacterized protein LOC144605065 isoform X1 [Rhinoraja longicauda]
MSDIMETRYEVGRKLRLKCQKGYKRKAGKSNLIKCQNGSEFAKWSDPILQCVWMGGTPPPAPSTSSTEIPKDLTPTVHDTSDINRTVPSGKSIGLVIGASMGSCLVILLVILLFVWPLVCKNRNWCTRPAVAEHELTPMALTEVQTVVTTSESGLLQRGAES